MSMILEFMQMCSVDVSVVYYHTCRTYGFLLEVGSSPIQNIQSLLFF